MPTSDELWRDLCEHDGLGRVACTEPRGEYNASVAAPVVWRSQEEVVNLQELIEETIETTHQTRTAARSLLNQTNGDYKKLRETIIKEFRDKSSFQNWRRGKTVRAFAFANMVMTAYKSTKAEKRGWWDPKWEGLVNR